MQRKTETEQINYSLDLYRQHEYEKAKKICNRLLRKKADNETVLINLGNIFFMEKKYEEALQKYKQAEEKNPDSFLVKVNIANVYLEQENYLQAEEYARQAIIQDSQNYMALNILGTALLEEEKTDEALEVLERALQYNKEDAWLYNYLSRCYQTKGMIKEALEAGWKAIEKAPQDESHHINFGYMLYELSLDSQEKIIEKYAQKWLDEYPQNKIVQHMGKAMINQSIPEQANQEYISKIFDIFAPDFEKVLSDLEYQTPQIISRFLAEIYGKDSHARMKILDAGCGTGLCGKILKPYTGFLGLSGVDLSAKMLEKAKEKKVYNRLYCQDIIEFLKKKKNQYDLIVSADVLTYFGRLDSFFATASQALKKGGRILFSITKNDENDSAYVLHKSGRYKHQKTYVDSLLKANGFEIEKAEENILRKEASRAVKGYVISGRKA